MSATGASGALLADGRLEWTLSWGWGPRLAVLGLCVAVLVLAWHNLGQLQSLRQRAVLLGLRGALVGSLFLAFLQPTWVSERRRAKDRVVAVLVDHSRSMQRGDRAARAAQVATALQAQGNGQTYAFAARLEGLSEASASLGDDTDIGAALAALAGAARPDGLAAVVVISDGLDPRLERGVSDATREAIAALGVPVHTVAPVSPTPLMDLEVAAVRASPYAFVRNQLPLEIDLRVHGFAGQPGSTRLAVLLDGDVVATRDVTLEGPSARTVQLAIQPKAIGAHVLSVQVAPLPGEATRVNNRSHRALHVVRDRTRVLLLAGHPSWDTRFLRSHLRADPAVDLVSFYIMVGRGGGVFVRGADTSLIPFPTTQLFGEALDDFDLIIFQDFDFAPFGITEHLPRLRRWVQQGGAFAVTGGVESLTSGGWDRSSLSQWLPLRMASPTQRDQGWLPGAFSPKRTDIGRRHPVTRLADDPATDERLWRRLTLAGHNSLLTPRRGAAVLLHGPEGSPLLTLAEVADGRVAVLATDSLWTWAFPAGDVAERDEVRRAYHRLLSRLRGWLLRDPAYATVRVRQRTPAVTPGEAVEFDVDVVGADQRPLADAPLTLAAWPLPRSGPAPAPTALDVRTDAAGRARVTWRAPHGGPWRVRVAAPGGRSGELAVAVAEAREEDLRVQPAPERLRRLATQAGGEHFGAQARPVPLAPEAGPELAEFDRRELWSSLPVAALLFGLLIAEWALRRRWGLA